MNEPQTNSTTPDLPTPEEESPAIASLRHQITLLLLALIVISGTLTTYLFYQSHTMGRELVVLEPRARMIIDNYNKNVPHIQKFLQTLVAYGKEHPDFRPILRKSGIAMTLPSTNAAAKPAAATPAAPQPKK